MSYPYYTMKEITGRLGYETYNLCDNCARKIGIPKFEGKSYDEVKDE
jgi:hypothetical protein